MKRVTVYLEPQLHQALKLRAAETDRSVSDLVNDAIRSSLGRDLEDLETLSERDSEPGFSFELVLHNLRRRGEI